MPGSSPKLPGAARTTCPSRSQAPDYTLGSPGCPQHHQGPCQDHREWRTHPAGHQELVPELHSGVVEGELLAAQVVDRRVALQVQE